MTKKVLKTSVDFFSPKNDLVFACFIFPSKDYWWCNNFLSKNTQFQQSILNVSGTKFEYSSM